MDDLRTIAARRAAGEDPVALPGERIGFGLIGEREARVRIEHEAVADMDHAVRLAETEVEEQPRGRDVRIDAGEYDPVAFVFIEAAIDEIAQVASALRGAVRECPRQRRPPTGRPVERIALEACFLPGPQGRRSVS